MIRSLSEWKTRSNQEIRALEPTRYVDVSRRAARAVMLQLALPSCASPKADFGCSEPEASHAAMNDRQSCVEELIALVADHAVARAAFSEQ